jgi:monoamine oxidase
VVILEASDRVGGRIYTIRSPFSPGLHFEAGAMRIPYTHNLVLEYIRKLRLPIRPFINSTPEDRIFVNGVNVRRWEYERNPDQLHYPVAPQERGKTAEALFETVAVGIRRLFQRYRRRYWRSILEEMTNYSLDTFLKYNPFGIRLSEGAVEMIRVLMTAQGVSGLSFLELYRILRVYLDPNMRFYEIEGGNDRLPRALSARLKEHIMFGQKMDCIRCDPDRVTIRTVSTKTRKHASYQGDYAIITIPFSALRLVKVVPYHAFSHHKRKAIRELHYVAATKIGVSSKAGFGRRREFAAVKR